MNIVILHHHTHQLAWLSLFAILILTACPSQTTPDTVKPTLTVTSSTVTTTNSIVIEGKAADNTSINQLLYRLNDGAEIDVTDHLKGGNFSFNVSNLIDGENTVNITASDKTNNRTSVPVIITRQLDIARTWKDFAVPLSICQGDGIAHPSLQFSLERGKNNSLTGAVILINYRIGVTARGQFTGTIENERNIQGEMNLFDSRGKSRNYDIVLERSGNILEGSLIDQQWQECRDRGGYDRWQGELVLIPNLAEAFEGDTFEPNNSMQDATLLQVGGVLDNLTLTANDIDWFTFELDEAAIVAIDIKLLSAFEIQVVKFAESELAKNSNTLGDLQTQSNTDTIRQQLPAGMHYLAITGLSDESLQGAHSENGQYKIHFKSMESLPDKAYEPNDSIEQARDISLYFSEDSLFLASDDKDWFRFTLDTIQLVTFDLTVDNVNYYGIDVTLFNSEGNMVRRFDFFKGQTVKQIHSLKPDTYYVQVSGFIDDDVYRLGGGRDGNYGTYRMTIDGNPPPDKIFEPNDILDQAYGLEADALIAPYMVFGDIDWFSFTLTEETNIKAVITNPDGSESIEDFYELVVTLYDDEQTKLASIETYYDMYKIETTLAAGTYYLEVSGFIFAFAGDDYDFENPGGSYGLTLMTLK